MNEKTTVKQKFCARFNCIEEAYEQVALKQFLPRAWQWSSMPLLVIKRRVLAVDIELLERLAGFTDLRAIESFDFRAHYRQSGSLSFLRRIFGFQISRARVLNFARVAFAPNRTPSTRRQPSEDAAAYLRHQTH